MYYIVDNGGDYSDHTIYFINVTNKELDEYGKEKIEELLLSPHYGGAIIATSEHFEWRTKNRFCSLIEYFQPDNVRYWFGAGGNGKDFTLPTNLKNQWIEYWEKHQVSFSYGNKLLCFQHIINDIKQLWSIV